jgi:hypothetical protein
MQIEDERQATSKLNNDLHMDRNNAIDDRLVEEDQLLRDMDGRGSLRGAAVNMRVLRVENARLLSLLQDRVANCVSF